jgi:hypothetical protein
LLVAVCTIRQRKARKSRDSAAAPDLRAANIGMLLPAREARRTKRSGQSRRWAVQGSNLRPWD